MCVRFASFIIPLKQDTGFKLWIQIDRADFTGWMYFLSSNLTEEMSTILAQVPKTFDQHGMAEEAKII